MSEQTFVIISDHSRIATDEHCPRERYWCYEYLGRGLERVALNIDALVGTACHNVLKDVMLMAKTRTYSDVKLAESLLRHVGAFEKDVRERGLSLELSSGYEQDEDGNIAVQAGQLDFLIGVYSCWIRQTLTAWTLLRLPQIVQEYEVVDVEREEDMLMAEGQLRFLARYDGLLRRWSDGELFIINFKTVGEANQWWQEQWPLDMQTLSEVLPTEARLGQRVSGVLIEGLVKGGKRLQYPSGSGNWWINSPLVWMWKKDAAAPFPPEYAGKYEWTDETGNHRLGKGWHKQPVWQDEMGEKEWLLWLSEHEPELLRAQFVQLPPILRSDQACERWIEQTEAREMDISFRAGAIEQQGLNATFPMHTSGGNCVKFRSVSNPGKCSCYELCHGMAAMDPLNNGYKLREANHPEEAVVRWGERQPTDREVPQG